ncbi:MAG: peptide chain release factor N(5)-glutamine methyltransferase [Solirubrobacterales bacterium]|nr:peptide chain release factor N(5)-glutamine methyltransferase [Solirubrobacterales bacterium]
MAGPFAGVPVREALASARIAREAAEGDSPRLDAELLLAHALGIDRTRLMMDRDAPVEGAAVQAFQAAVRRRTVERVPTAYLLGEKGFRRLDLQVDPRVLIPRPDTEALVEWAVHGLPRGTRVLDVGTGSGAIALALKDERPDLEVTGTDVSPGAMEVARGNAARLGLDVRFVEGDLLAGERADVVVSNPPYVETGAELAPEITLHEPAGALFAGADGLDVYRRLVPAIIEVGARIAGLEVGAGQASSVRALFPPAWETDVGRDLGGIDRVVSAWRP